jgi:hypothetical protein
VITRPRRQKTYLRPCLQQTDFLLFCAQHGMELATRGEITPGIFSNECD